MALNQRDENTRQTAASMHEGVETWHSACACDLEEESGGETGRQTAASMHREIETWEDTCVCEPEPRWAKLVDEDDA